MKMSPLHNRAAILLFFLFLWAALVAAHLFYYSIIASDLYIERGNAIAKRKGAIHAKSGRILDADGRPLLWIETAIDLYVEEVPKFPFYRKKLERAIAKYFIDFTFPEDSTEICLQKNISPLDQLHLYPLVKRFPEIIFKERRERKYISEDLKKTLDSIAESNKETLKGKDGFFEVMADRNGRWIPKTWKATIQARSGKDINLNQTYKELKRETEVFPK